MRHYELVTILSPMLNQDDASATWDEIKSFITNREGEITAEQTWGTRRLAYPIRKGNYNFLEGSYYLSSFAVDNPFNRELENYLRLHDNVLRALVVRCDGPLADKPAPGPLTAPSRYIPPGRGRRNDGGGPIPEAPAGATERGSGPPAGAAPAAPSSEASPAAPSAPADAPVTEATPEAPPADQTAAQAVPAAAPAEPVAAQAPPTEESAAQPAPDAPAPAAEPAATPEPDAGESTTESST
ncbi:MAG: 30S ribosomal protein S6 [Chloroflexota bacterium]|nr:30S ribosomal protein S6 [Chloroflexota bacterium]MDE2684345.1 30S ribosomal protein S6 [Chloroflexota bacterium]